mmetsp:Transcript_15197/g.42009  ORF Transcript_15197/g.42009 Transcript_15197/m.42009 type:complete len:207 (-) Transcript_15197:221-841(-)
MLLDGLLLVEASVLVFTRFDSAWRLVADAQRADDVCVFLLVFPDEVIQQSASLVDEGHEASAGGVVLWILLEVLGEVADALCHAGDLELGASSVLLRSSPCGSEFIHALLGCEPGRWLAVILDSGGLVVLLLELALVEHVVILFLFGGALDVVQDVGGDGEDGLRHRVESLAVLHNFRDSGRGWGSWCEAFNGDSANGNNGQDGGS